MELIIMTILHIFAEESSRHSTSVAILRDGDNLTLVSVAGY